MASVSDTDTLNFIVLDLIVMILCCDGAAAAASISKMYIHIMPLMPKMQTVSTQRTSSVIDALTQYALPVL
jgi:maltose-binding protein MalE